MGLFDWLFGKDPTADFGDAFTAPLEYDFDKHALCGVKIGSPVADLRKFGRAEDAPRARKNVLAYYTKGFQVELEQGHAMDFVIGFADDWAPPEVGARPFAGRFRLKGGGVRLGPTTCERDVIGLFGEPADREVHTYEGESDEVVLGYDFAGEVHYDFEFDGDKLRRISVIGEHPAGKRK